MFAALGKHRLNPEEDEYTQRFDAINNEIKEAQHAIQQNPTLEQHKAHLAVLVNEQARVQQKLSAITDGKRSALSR
jgi:hypothetical protein